MKQRHSSDLGRLKRAGEGAITKRGSQRGKRQCVRTNPAHLVGSTSKKPSDSCDQELRAAWLIPGRGIERVWSVHVLFEHPFLVKTLPGACSTAGRKALTPMCPFSLPLLLPEGSNPWGSEHGSVRDTAVRKLETHRQE